MMLSVVRCLIFTHAGHHIKRHTVTDPDTRTAARKSDTKTGMRQPAPEVDMGMAHIGPESRAPHARLQIRSNARRHERTRRTQRPLAVAHVQTCAVRVARPQVRGHAVVLE